MAILKLSRRNFLPAQMGRQKSRTEDPQWKIEIAIFYPPPSILDDLLKESRSAGRSLFLSDCAI
jgi:hypothetical protein